MADLPQFHVTAYGRVVWQSFFHGADNGDEMHIATLGRDTSFKARKYTAAEARMSEKCIEAWLNKIIAKQY